MPVQKHKQKGCAYHLKLQIKVVFGVSHANIKIVVLRSIS